MIKNWAGQEIRVGDVVWRGARDGNMSSFRVGRVVAIHEDKRTAHVRYAPARWGAKHGTTTINSLAVIDPATLSDEVRESIPDA